MTLATAARRTAEIARNAKTLITAATTSTPAAAARDELAEQLADARTDLQAAKRALDEATARFNERTDDDDTEVDECARAEALAQRRLQRAQFRVNARATQRAAEERSQLVAKREALRSELAGGVLAARQTELVELEARALVAAIEARNELWQIENSARSKQLEIASITEQLGEERPNVGTTAPAPPTEPTIALLDQYCADLPSGDRRQSMATDAIKMIAPGYFRRPSC